MFFCLSPTRWAAFSLKNTANHLVQTRDIVHAWHFEYVHVCMDFAEIALRLLWVVSLCGQSRFLLSVYFCLDNKGRGLAGA